MLDQRRLRDKDQNLLKKSVSAFMLTLFPDSFHTSHVVKLIQPSRSLRFMQMQPILSRNSIATRLTNHGHKIY